MRPFFLRIVRKGKRNNNHTQRATKTMQEDKERQPEQRRTTSIKGGKHRSKRRKAKGQKERQTRHKPLIRLTPHAYKAPQATQSTRTTQTHTTTTKPAKNALKTRNRAISEGSAPKTKRESRRKEGTHNKRTRANLRQVLKPQRARPPATSGHAKRPAQPAPLAPPPAYTFQKYIRFSPIVVSDFPEVRQKHANKCLLLPCF